MTETESKKDERIDVVGNRINRTVSQAYAGGEVAKSARVGFLGNEDVQKTPFTIIGYTDKIIQDRQAVTVEQALRLDPSIRMTQGTGAPFDSFYIRGFPIGEGTSGEIAFDGLYGVAPSFRVFTDYAERIEVLKGPAGALSGVSPNGGIGGVINIVPKVAGKNLSRFTADYYSAARFGGQWDIARRYGRNREWGVRFSGSGHDGNTPINRQKERTTVGFLSVDYQSGRLRAWVDALAQNDHFDAPLRPYYLSSAASVPEPQREASNVTQPWEYSNITDYGGRVRLEYDILHDLMFFANIGGGKTSVDRYFASAVTVLNNAGNTLTAPQYYGMDISRYTVDGGFRATLQTGKIRNKISLQSSLYQENTERFLSAVSGSYKSNIYDPVSVASIPQHKSDARPKLSDSTLYGVSLADTLSVFDDRILLTAGFREQGIDARNYVSNVGRLSSVYNKMATTPFSGLVVNIAHGLSIYGNYIQGLRRGDTAPALASNSGEILAPYVSEQIESGIKADYGRFTTNLAFFQITKPSGELSPTLVYSQTNEQRMRGLEISAYGELVHSVHIVGGVTVLDGRLHRTTVSSNLNHRPIGVPSVQMNVGGDWDIPFIRGLNLNSEVTYTDHEYVDLANRKKIPQWVCLGLGLKYTTHLEKKALAVRFNVQNVANAQYWGGVASYGTFMQGLPRSFMLSTSIDM